MTGCWVGSQHCRTSEFSGLEIKKSALRRCRFSNFSEYSRFWDFVKRAGLEKRGIDRKNGRERRTLYKPLAERQKAAAGERWANRDCRCGMGGLHLDPHPLKVSSPKTCFTQRSKTSFTPGGAGMGSSARRSSSTGAADQSRETMSRSSRPARDRRWAPDAPIRRTTLC